jgi:flagellar assembly protein FliH
MTVAVPQAEPARAFVPAEARTWAAPVIDGAAVASGRGRRLTEAQREDERQLAALAEKTRTINAMLEALSRPLGQVDEVIHEQIATLALLIARAVVRRELRADPSQIIGIVRDTVALLPASGRGARVALHPEDAAMVRERLTPAGPEASWSIAEDPTLSRGDCRVYTDYARLDARIETRLNEALAALVGEERVRSRNGEAA